MWYGIAADLTLLVHVAFILFVVLGAALAARWRWMPLLHLPAAVWGAYVELAPAACPLTVIENRLLRLAGESGYAGGFVERYLLPVVYPSGLTPGVQRALGCVVLALNAVLYAWVLHRRRRGRRHT